MEGLCPEGYEEIGTVRGRCTGQEREKDLSDEQLTNHKGQAQEEEDD